MASNRVVAVFLMCMFVATAMHAYKAEAAGDTDTYKKCYVPCQKDCFKDGEGNGYSFCEKKCDENCSDEEIKAKLKGLKSSP